MATRSWGWARDPNARRYLYGFTASMLGSGAMTLVAGVWIKTLTQNTSAAALVSFCVFAPSLLAPLAGMLADRVRRRRLLVATNLGMAVALLALLFVTDRGDAWLIYLVMLVYGAARALLDPAETGLFTTLFDATVRGRLNGLKMTVQEGGKLIAPLAGAGLFTLLGGGAVAALDAAAFVFAVIALLALRTTDPVPPRTTGRPRAELSAGARHITGTPALCRPVLGAATVMLITGFIPAIQFGILDAVHQPPAYLGVLVSVLGAASLLAGLTAPALLARIGERGLIAVGMVNTAVAAVILMIPWLPAVLAGMALRGFGLPWIVVVVLTLTQNHTEAGLQGRVSAAVSMLLFAPVSLAGGLGAGLIAIVNYRVLLAAIVCAGVLSTIYVLGGRPARRTATGRPAATGDAAASGVRSRR